MVGKTTFLNREIDWRFAKRHLVISGEGRNFLADRQSVNRRFGELFVYPGS
jgi:hypothetical protein